MATAGSNGRKWRHLWRKVGIASSPRHARRLIKEGVDPWLLDTGQEAQANLSDGPGQGRRTACPTGRWTLRRRHCRHESARQAACGRQSGWIAARGIRQTVCGVVCVKRPAAQGDDHQPRDTLQAVASLCADTSDLGSVSPGSTARPTMPSKTIPLSTMYQTMPTLP